jgi:hypothetical protein
MSVKKANQPLMMRRDYDTPEAAMIKPLVPVQVPEVTPEETTDELVEETIGVPSAEGFKLVCPTCNEGGVYNPEERVDQSSVLVCPKCASKVEIGMFTKTASGEYRVKFSSCLDPNFGSIYEILPKRAEEITLSKSAVSKLLKNLRTIESAFSKLRKTLSDK